MFVADVLSQFGCTYAVPHINTSNVETSVAETAMSSKVKVKSKVNTDIALCS